MIWDKVKYNDNDKIIYIGADVPKRLSAKYDKLVIGKVYTIDWIITGTITGMTTGTTETTTVLKTISFL